jgi:4-diphosphocytidyl-2-C-methyl-D-erythritol kinase
MLILPAPAKLNLFLHVTGQRADGYHELQTVFQFIELADEITLHPRDDAQIRLMSPLPGVDEQDDLTLRAATLLAESAGIASGANISLKKRIPMGAGLGGGSSDAASVLCGLNEMWGLGLSRQQLAGLGGKLGADVPVFINGHAAWAEGTGDILTAVELPEPDYLLVVPPVHVSTAEIFGDPALTRDSSPIRILDFHEGKVGNDLEKVVRRNYPQVDEVMTWLQQFASPRMTGSGAGVFIEVDSRQAGQHIADQAPPQWQCFVTRGMNTSPLHERLSELTNGV